MRKVQQINAVEIRTAFPKKHLDREKRESTDEKSSDFKQIFDNAVETLNETIQVLGTKRKD